jgi:hypothetical protein
MTRIMAGAAYAAPSAWILHGCRVKPVQFLSGAGAGRRIELVSDTGNQQAPSSPPLDGGPEE